MKQHRALLHGIALQFISKFPHLSEGPTLPYPHTPTHPHSRIVAAALLALALLAPAALRAADPPCDVSNLTLDGEIEGENIVFNLAFDVEANRSGAVLPLVVGDVAYLDGRFPRRATLGCDERGFNLTFSRRTRGGVAFKFASRPVKDGEWRQTTFSIPSSSLSRLSVLCDRDDLEVRFPGALEVKREKTKSGKTQVTAFLGTTDHFEVRWKPEVRKLEADLVVACDANSIGTATVGALKLDTIFTYRVIQGVMNKVSLKMPEANVTQVTGSDIQDWQIDRSDAANPRLVVTLSRPQEGIYRLRVETEMALSKFPCKMDMPALIPENVIRTSGFLMVGTDSAIKLQIEKALGLTQVDQVSFPTVTLAADPRAAKRAPDARRSGPVESGRAKPTRSVYTYQYANLPYTLAMKADDIVTSLVVDDQLSLSMAENEMVFDAALEIDVKDAPAREIVIAADPDVEWTVTAVTGRYVSEPDTDVREEKGRRVIYVPFKEAVSGSVLVNVRMEKTLKPEDKTFSVPKFEVVGAKSERGYLVIAAERGIRLKTEKAGGLREVHTGSTRMKVRDAQQAFRFREPGWRLSLSIERATASVHSESFHLVSLGEGVMYCSAAFTYHIGGSPLQQFKLRVPKEIETVEFTGADIEGWTREGDICTVRLQARVMGDYTLLVTYNRQFAYGGAGITVGGIETVGAESEVGYVAIASAASIDVRESGPLPASVIKIGSDEIPRAYSATITDPILFSFKYTRWPHAVKVGVTPFETDRLLGQVADYVRLTTDISRDGEAVTTATYFIKNATRQHLVLTMPKGANLWTIKHIDENGNKTDARSQKSGDEILIPVVRPPDPNTPLAIEVVFARSYAKLGLWRSGLKGLRLTAPVMPETNASFAKWEVRIPAGFSLAESRGNMIAGMKTMVTGFEGVLRVLWRLCRAALDGWGGRTLWGTLTYGQDGGQPGEYTRAVNLSGMAPLSLDLRVVPAWFGTGSSPVEAVAALGAGVLLLAGSIARKKRRALTALGLTVLLYAVAQTTAGRSGAAALVAVFVVALVVKYALRLMALLHRRAQEARERDRAGNRRAAASTISRVRSGRDRRAQEGAGGGQDPDSEGESAIPPPPFEPVPTEGDESEKRGEGDSGSMGVGECGSVGEERETGKRGSGETGREGSARIRGLILALALSLAAGLALAEAKQAAAPAALKPAVPPAPALDSLDIAIEGPGTGRDVEKSAKVTARLTFEADEPVSFGVVPTEGVLTGFEPGSRYLEVEKMPEGYLLSARYAGRYEATVTYRMPVSEKDGKWRVSLAMLKSMRNKVVLKLPEPDMEIESEYAVLFKTERKEKTSEATAVFGPSACASFAWSPRVRKTKLEAALFFCELNSFVALRAGVVDVANTVRYQIPQGELKEMRLTVPANMSVTSVQGAGLATWSFDPKERLLDAILEKPVSGDYGLRVGTQVSCEGLPYSAAIGVPHVLGASRQRGAVAIAAHETVQVRVEDVKGMNPMNIEDFPAGTESGTDGKRERAGAVSVRRAFRYDRPEDVSATVHTEKVLPEVRVEESATLSIADERVVMATGLKLAVAKSGIFSVRLGIPPKFDVETLTGRDVSHWDEANTERPSTGSTALTTGEPRAGGTGNAELGAGSGEQGREVVVHLKREVTDSTDINMVIARVEKGIEDRIEVPRVSVVDARKHHGKLTISGEKGVRLMVESHTGVDAKKASEEGIRQAGVLVFDILRPNWAISLRTQVLAPVVRPEVLQCVDIAEGILQCRAYLKYKIENAGVKTFRLAAPAPGVTLSVTGRNIARVNEADREKGIWQVDLHNKQEESFMMNVTYQVPYDTASRAVKIRPLGTLDTEDQRGYLVVTCSGRVQVKREGDQKGLKPEDARNIPAEFKAGDLSGAIQCYRTIKSDYELLLSVVRHDAARVLPAKVESLTMTSVSSASGRLLTRATLTLSVGDMRFLKVALPNKDDSLWTTLVNGREATVARDGALYCVPLEAHAGGRVTTVELIYSGSASRARLFGRRVFSAPKFQGLPLSDIRWDFYVVPGWKFARVGGTMELAGGSEVPVTFDADMYWARTREERQERLRSAKENLDAGGKFLKAGRQKEAKKAFEQAMVYSKGQTDLNEDARVQLRNLEKQQVKIGLYNRRGAVRQSQNVLEPQQAEEMEGFRDGEYTQEYAQGLERRLSDRDNDALEVVANKMIEQQTAAAGVVSAIRATIPEHGRLLSFHRATQVDPNGDVTVAFKAGHAGLLGALNALWPAALVFLALWGVLARRGARAA